MTKTKLDHVIPIEQDFLFALSKNKTEKRIGILRNRVSSRFIVIKGESDGHCTGVEIIGNSSGVLEKKFQGYIGIKVDKEDTEIYLKISLLKTREVSLDYTKSYFITEFSRLQKRNIKKLRFQNLEGILVAIVILVLIICSVAYMTGGKVQR